jgi:hypothetical protein
MSQSQQDLRRAAAQEFMKSLDQLGRSLTAAEEAAQAASEASNRQPLSADAAEAKALAEAAADIEQFFIQAQDPQV